MGRRSRQSQAFTQHLGLSVFTSIRRRRIASDLSAGFTIAELLIASTVFSIILLLALTGFLEIGHLFYKGVSTTQNQNTAKQIIDDLSSSVQTADSIQLKKTYGDYNYYCLGNSRYTYRPQYEVDLSKAVTYGPDGNFGLLKDKLPGASPCAAPCAPSVDTCPGGTAPFNKPVDLLTDKMRLADLQIDPGSASPNLYTISVVLAYGDDDVLDLSDTSKPACKGNLSEQQFCSVDNLTTSVYKGFSP